MRYAIDFNNMRREVGWYLRGFLCLVNLFLSMIATRQSGIYNLYTQSRIGGKRAVDYEAFHKSLSFVAENLHYNYANGEDDVILGLPYGISCGLAGGSWEIIYSMINEILVDKKFKTYIVKYDE